MGIVELGLLDIEEALVLVAGALGIVENLLAGGATDLREAASNRDSDRDRRDAARVGKRGRCAPARRRISEPCALRIVQLGRAQTCLRA
ncbi:MAG TPA: hypothetical protein VGF63_13075 [Solirubrobacteraceae bacterium]